MDPKLQANAKNWSMKYGPQDDDVIEWRILSATDATAPAPTPVATVPDHTPVATAPDPSPSPIPPTLPTLDETGELPTPTVLDLNSPPPPEAAATPTPTPLPPQSTKDNIPWNPDTNLMNYNEILFKHFFPLKAGVAARLDKFLRRPNRTGYPENPWRDRVVSKNIVFNRPDAKDPDALVSMHSLLYVFCFNSNHHPPCFVGKNMLHPNDYIGA
jgi:hypothetical protein